MARATPVHKSVIAESRTCGPLFRTGACRWRGLRRAGVLEESEETGIGGEHKRCAMAGERVAIGLHRTIESKELLILAERVSVDTDALRVAVAAHLLGVPLRLGDDHGAFAVGIGPDGLRRLRTLGAVLCRLLLTFRHHAGKDRLAVLFGQIGAADAHVDD